jgi:hypothetical protein
MKSYSKLFLSFFILTIGGGLLSYRLWLGFWPPRTPVKIIQKVIGVSVKNLGVKKYYEQWLPNGDGTLLVIIKTDSASVPTILSKSNLDFKHLDIINNHEVNALVKAKLDSVQAGWYYFKKEKDQSLELVFISHHDNTILYWLDIL